MAFNTSLKALSAYTTEETANETSFTLLTLQDFARLILLLALNDDVRRAIVKSGTEHDREELNQRVSSYAISSSVVAPVFNDSTVSL